jgi:opacity protein-like surface antigen
MRLKYFCSGCFLILIFSINGALAQVIRVGLKAGAQFSWTSKVDASQSGLVKIAPALGFNCGAVASFKVKDRYFLHTEYLYSTKGKITTGRASFDPRLKDKVSYQFIDVPILYTIHFKGRVGKSKQFKWYFGAGPVISYWLGGKGEIVSGEHIENSIPPYKYSIRFGTREDHSRPDLMYVKDPKRFQFALNVGVGLLFEPVKKHIVMVDLRYEYGNTRMAKGAGDFITPAIYDQYMKVTNQGFRLGLIYVLESSLDPKQLNRGKSTIKSK